MRNLHCLGEILDAAAAQDKVEAAWIREFVGAARPGDTALGRALAEGMTRARGRPLGVALERGRATIPLTGIDVPFHSSRLQPGVPASGPRACAPSGSSAATSPTSWAGRSPSARASCGRRPRSRRARF